MICFDYDVDMLCDLGRETLDGWMDGWICNLYVCYVITSRLSDSIEGGYVRPTVGTVVLHVLAAVDAKRNELT